MVRCQNCGTELSDQAHFCHKCGSHIIPQAEEAPAAQQPNTPPNKKLSKRSKIIIGIVIAVVVCAAAVAGYLFYQQYQQDEWNRQHQTYSIMLTIESGQDASTLSAVPIHIEGTDFEGNAVSSDALWSSSETEVASLMRGTYTISVSSSPITQDGTIFDTSTASTEIEVTGSDNSENAPTYDTQLPITAIGAESMTQEQIDAACEGLLAAGVSQSEVDTLRQAAEKKLSDYQAEQAAAAAAAAAAAEEAANTYETSAITFVMPKYWRGKVSVQTNSDGGMTFTDKQSGAELGFIDVTSVNAGLDAGDYATSLVDYKTKGSVRAELWTQCWAAIVSAAYPGTQLTEEYDNETLSRLVDLSTGGYIAFEHARAATDSEPLLEDAHKFMAETVMDCITVK